MMNLNSIGCIVILILFNGLTVITNAQFSTSLIDTLPNIYSTALNNIEPLSVAPYSNLLMFVHRANQSYSPSTGALVYNYSSDNGITWHLKLPPINSTTQTEARYPSSALFADSDGNTDSAMGFVYYTQINSASAYGIGQITDFAGGVSNAQLMSEAEPTPVCWSSGETGWFYYITSNSQGSYFLNRLRGLNQVETFPMISHELFSHLIPIAGDASAGKLVFGFLGLKPNTSGITSYMPGYVESSDNGITWSEIRWINWREAVGGARYDQLWDYINTDQNINLSADMVLDYRGLVHFAIGLTDTNVDLNHGRNSIAELYQTESYWSLLTVSTNLNDVSYMTVTGPAAGQMGYAVNIASARVMGAFAVSYVNPPGPQSTLCDVYVSTRTENMGYSYHVNVTQTPGKNENNMHMSPVISYNPDEYNLHVHLIHIYPLNYEGIFPNGQGFENVANAVYYTNILIPIPLSPVEFSSFTAEDAKGFNLLKWSTASEKNNMQFEIERKKKGGEFVGIGLVKGSGTISKPSDYTFYDKNPLPSANYRIKQIDYNGEFAYSPEIEVTNVYLHNFSLSGNFPNPFNPHTTISFTTETSGDLQFELYTSTGEKIDEKMFRILNGGEHKIEVEGERLVSGSYYYRLNFNGSILSGKMILLR